MNAPTLAYEISQVIVEAVATGLFVSVCSIQQPSGLLTADGSPDGTWTAVAGMQGIACMNAPTSEIRITADEKKTSREIESDNNAHVLLAGWYPQIQTQTNWRAVIDGAPYDILGAESDSQMTMTRMKIIKVTV